jgi:UTP--glucose-1-phosphate uridylyltransferase
MLPIVDVPTIQLVIDEAVRAGITDVIVVNGRHKHAIEDHFDHAYELEHTLRERGNAALADAMAAIAGMVRIHSVRQKQPLGLGHAVLAAREAAGEEACAILLGDDLVDNDRDPGIGQLVRAYEQTGAGTVMIMEVPEGREHMYGIVAGDLDAHGRMRIREMIEKPKPGTAPSRWAIVGRYVVPPEIWGHLAATAPGAGGEIQLTDALRTMAQAAEPPDGPVHGVVFRGRRYDTGDRLDYLKTVVRLAAERDDLGPDFRAWLNDFVTSPNGMSR